MDDLEVRQAPAFMAHILGHDAQALRLDLALAPNRVGLADVTALDSVAIGREDQPLPVQVGTDEKNGAAHRVQPDGTKRAAERTHVTSALVAPGVEIECRTARGGHT